MPQERFYLNQPLIPHTTVSLADTEFHHLVNVSRCRPGDSIELTNGMGQLAEATIDALEKKQATLTLHTVNTSLPPTRKIILAQAYPRANRLDAILEKVTELGATDIWLFAGENSERKEASPARIESILISAMKQSGTPFLPKCIQAPPIKHWDSLPCATVYGDFAEGAPHLLTQIPAASCMVVIGPESGLTENEEKKLKSLGAQGVSLHGNILRTDTAAIIAVAFISAKNHTFVN